MKKYLSLLPALLFSVALTAQNFTPADAGSSIKFVIKNFGLKVDGSFKGLHGKIVFAPANLSGSNFNVTLDAATVNTGNNSRDGHLKKEEYFNVAAFPLLQFVSTSIKAGEKTGDYIVTGTLTIKGTPKTISFPFTATGTPGGYLFAGNFSINRRDFKVGGNSLVLADVLNVSLNIAANK